MTIYKNLDKVFELESCDDLQVILKVKEMTPLLVAQYPFLSSDYSYITVTRGKNHILTIIHSNGTKFDFHWGEGGHTLISDGLELLRQNVIAFIGQSNIILDYDGFEPKKAVIYYHSYFNQWQLTIEGSGVSCYWRTSKAKDEKDMIKICEKFVKAQWEKAVAPTGIDIWKAIEPTFTLK